MIKNAYKRCFLKGAGAEAGIPARAYGPAPVMACSWWMGAVGPGEAGVHRFNPVLIPSHTRKAVHGKHH
jgi:hypothetical protein